MSEDDEPKVAALRLEEFLVLCQKSLARATLAAQEAAKADVGFRDGTRPLYTIDGIDFDLPVTFEVGKAESGARQIHIRLDGAVEHAPRLNFRLDSSPVDAISGATLELSNLDPIPGDIPSYRLRGWLVNEETKVQARHPVSVNFAFPGARKPAAILEGKTDSRGRIDLTVESADSVVNVRFGKQSESFSSKGRSEIYVWVITDISLAEADSAPERLESDTLRLPI